MEDKKGSLKTESPIFRLPAALNFPACNLILRRLPPRRRLFIVSPNKKSTVLGAVCNWFVKRILRQKAVDAVLWRKSRHNTNCKQPLARLAVLLGVLSAARCLVYFSF